MEKHNNLGPIFIVSGVLLAVVVAFVLLVYPSFIKPSTTLWLGDGVFNASVASDGPSREKGLSGVSDMASDHALLMAYPSDSKWKIWMNDMNIPIDIVWLNKDKKVIYIVKNASPKDSTLKVFEPNALARFVVEMPAGSVDSKAIKPSDVATFKIDLGGVK